MYVLQKLVGLGASHKISSIGEQNELRAAGKIFLLYWTGQKSSGVACTGVEKTCSGVENGVVNLVLNEFPM